MTSYETEESACPCGLGTVVRRVLEDEETVQASWHIRCPACEKTHRVITEWRWDYQTAKAYQHRYCVRPL